MTAGRTQLRIWRPRFEDLGSGGSRAYGDDAVPSMEDRRKGSSLLAAVAPSHVVAREESREADANERRGTRRLTARNWEGARGSLVAFASN